jgi:hypothetical protein
MNDGPFVCLTSPHTPLRSPPPLIPPNTCQMHTAGLPLTSPATNVDVDDPEQKRLTPNEWARAQVQSYKEGKTREWVEAEVRWREWQEAWPETAT